MLLQATPKPRAPENRGQPRDVAWRRRGGDGRSPTRRPRGAAVSAREPRPMKGGCES
uniref:Uncharacterized protein n=1 Tax=Mesocestoides corti TaxID=53468 RepID=A0A5K3F8R2_MESCO